MENKNVGMIEVSEDTETTETTEIRYKMPIWPFPDFRRHFSQRELKDMQREADYQARLEAEKKERNDRLKEESLSKAEQKRLRKQAKRLDKEI